MSFDTLLIDTVTIYNLGIGSTDRYGNELVAWDAGTSSKARVTVAGGSGQGASTENLGGRDTVITSYKVFLPAGANIDSGSRIVWGTKDLRVVGSPIRARNFADHHVEVTCEEVTGG